MPEVRCTCGSRLMCTGFKDIGECGGCGKSLRGDGAIWNDHKGWVLPEGETSKVVTSEPEAVDHPAHYNSGKYEVIDIIEDQLPGIDFHLGNSLKYICRAAHKDKQVEDLKKARWYLDRAITHLEKS